MGFEEFAFGVVASLVASVTHSYSGFRTLKYLKKRKVESRVDDATAQVVESLVGFLEKEGLNDIQKSVLIETCGNELKPITDEPAKLFNASLNGQIIFDNLYPDGKLPTAITEVGLSTVYALLCPRIATLICKVPEAIKDWESEAWSENYRRLDEIARDLTRLFNKVDELGKTNTPDDDELLLNVRKYLAQKVGLELDFTGLRSNKVQTGKLAEFFVHPQISQTIEGEHEKVTIGEADTCFNQFIGHNETSVIIGGPGSGKSTWTRWLNWMATGELWRGFVVRIELRRLNANEHPHFKN